MPECAFAELDRVRKCLLSSFVDVVVVVVVNREREVLPGMMKFTLWPRCRARASVTQNEKRRSAHEVRQRETKRQLKEMRARALYLLLLVLLLVLLFLRPRAGAKMMMMI